MYSAGQMEQEQSGIAAISIGQLHLDRTGQNARTCRGHCATLQH